MDRTYTLSETLSAQYNATRSTAHREQFCHAPFVSMNFQQNGDVLVCCFNRKYVIGRVPDQTLHEIWFGEKAQKLRKAMARNRLPMGCDKCIHQFESRNFESLHAKEYDSFADGGSGDEATYGAAYPRVMEFEISNQCNLECVMCTGYYSSAIRKNREKLPPMPFRYGEGFVEQLEEFMPHLRQARFLGGEPFMITPYIEIWEKLVHLNPEVNLSITTNATLLSDRVKKVLENLRVWVVVSVDSLKKETYEKIRVNANYEKVQANIAYLKRYKKRKKTGMSFAVCPMTDNWQEMANLVSYGIRNGIRIHFNTVIRPLDRSLMFLPTDTLSGILHKMRRQYYSKGLFVFPMHPNVLQYRSLLNQVEEWIRMAASASGTEKKAEDPERAAAGYVLFPQADQNCFETMLRILPELIYQHSGNESSELKMGIRLNYVSDELDRLKRRHESRPFVFSYLCAANCIAKRNAPDLYTEETVLNGMLPGIAAPADKQDLWDAFASKLFTAKPMEVLRILKSLAGKEPADMEQALSDTLFNKG